MDLAKTVFTLTVLSFTFRTTNIVALLLVATNQ